LTEDVLARPNLDVVLHAQVTQIQSNKTVGGVPVFDAVEFATNATSERCSPRRCAYELIPPEAHVVLSAPRRKSSWLPGRSTRHRCGTPPLTLSSHSDEASAFFSFFPQLLLLSGLGDPARLRSVNITPVVDLPAVGQGVADQPLATAAWTVRSNRTLSTFVDDPANFAAALGQWNASGTGPLSFLGTTQVGWLRVPAGDPVFATAPDPSSGPHSAHYEFLIGVSGGGRAHLGEAD
jgi:hypothetical protein